MGTWSHGSIVRVYMKNFMQYGEATFEPGPCLNVILGPNGSGKSTLVNAICLGVGGKAKFLDRAKDPREFIREGTESSEIKIELYNANDGEDNWIITRKWSTRDSKTYWILNGKSVPQKQIDVLTKGLQIQVENLCQFLPQDKVQSFSKMNAQTLLDSTIDAVGEEGLKEKHRQLKELQRDFENFEDQFRSDQEILAQKRTQMERMDGDVKNYHEKKKVDDKISLYKKKKVYLLYGQKKEEVREIDEDKKKLEVMMRHREKSEAKPIETSINRIKNLIESNDDDIRNRLMQIRDYVNDSKNYSNKIENLMGEYNNCDVELEEIVSQTSERQAKIESIQNEIRSLKNNQADEEVQRQFNEANKELTRIAQEESNLDIKLKSIDRERNQIDREIAFKQEEIKKLNDVSSIKISKLENSFTDGKDVVAGFRHLKTLNLKGTFYEPLILTLILKDISNAFYFENVIQTRDLVAFGAEEKEDVSKIIQVLRKEKGLKINAIHLASNVDMDAFQPKVAPESIPREYNFKGYLSDLFDAPLPVKAFLCKQYQLHNTAVFGPVTPATINKIIDLKISNFFVERERFNVIVSAYTSEYSTTSFTAHPRNWIQMGVDSSKVQALEKQKEKLEEEKLTLLDSIRVDHQALRDKRKSKEETTEKVTKLKQKVNLIKQHKNKLQMKERSLSELILANQDSSSEERAKKECEDRKKNIMRKLVERNGNLLDVIAKHADTKISMELNKLKSLPFTEELKSEQLKLEKVNEEMSDIRRRIEDMKKEAKKKMDEAQEYASELEKLTGSRRVSEELKDLWEENNVPDDVDRIVEDINGLETESSCIGNINRSVVEEYLRLKESVTNLEERIASKETETSQKREGIDTLKSEWIGKLTSLVDRLDSKFRSNFDYMGYAGQIQLKVPDERNNFNDDYGIEIYVKYRENVRLAKLTPHLQSGGERSVATALYMMSLQELTKVPFRCVDEINQGMDAINERKVFDILINTSSKKEASAQYFLLTPKLLPDLSFNELVKIHVVYNGTHMLQHPAAMSAGKFLEKACQRGL